VRTAILISLILALPLCVGAGGSQENWGLFGVLFPSRLSGPIFPPDWVAAAGEVAAVSPDAEASSASGVAPATSEPQDAWLAVRVVRPILRTHAGDELAVHFKRSARRPADENFMRSDTVYMKYARFGAGDRVIVVAKPKDGKLVPVSDIYPLESYDDFHLKALEEYGRWDGLAPQEQLEAIGRAVLRSDNTYLRGQAMGLLSARALAAGRREWAMAILAPVARAKPGVGSPDFRYTALVAARCLYSIEERSGVSRQVLDLSEELLNDSALTPDLKQNILTDLQHRAWRESSRPEGHERRIFRQRALDILDRFLAREQDAELRQTAQAQRDALLRLRGRATEVVAD